MDAIAVIKHHDQKQLWGKMADFNLQIVVHHPDKSEQEVKLGTRRQELKQRLWTSADYWIAPIAFL